MLNNNTQKGGTQMLNKTVQAIQNKIDRIDGALMALYGDDKGKEIQSTITLLKTADKACRPTSLNSFINQMEY